MNLRQAFYRFTALTKIIDQSQTRLIIEILPPILWTISVSSMFLSIAALFFTEIRIYGFIFLTTAFIIFVLGYRKRLILDIGLNKFTYARKSLLGTTQEIKGKSFPLDQISNVYVETSMRRRLKSEAEFADLLRKYLQERTRAVIETKDGSIKPLQFLHDHYHQRHIRITQVIRSFLQLDSAIE